MTRSLAFALLASVAFTGLAQAADKAGPAEATAPVPQAAAAPLPFQGLYVGITAAHSTGTLKASDGFKLPREGYSGGGFVGYNHRLPGLVIGGEADLALTDIVGTASVEGITVKASSRYLGSARLRVGYPLGHTLIYATGGLALTNGKLSVTSIGADSGNTRGLVYGAGLEAMLLGNLGIRLEALRYEWDTRSYDFGGNDSAKLGAHDTHVRVGLIVKL